MRWKASKFPLVGHPADMNPPVQFAGASESLEEFIDGEPGIAYERAKRSDGQFLVLGNRQVHADSGLDQNQMTANLPQRLPPRLPERASGLASPDVPQSPHG